MRRWTFLLRPGWLALGVVVAAFAYLCFTVLAPWQLGKNTRTSRENSQIEHSLTADPVALTTLLPQQDSTAPDAQWQRVTATGHYLADKQVLVRLQPVDGSPAFKVLAPFAVDHGPTVLVNRGYVRPVEASRVPPIPPPPPGTVSVIARLRDPEPAIPGKEPLTDQGFAQVYSLDTAQVAQLTGVPLTAAYLQLVADQPGGLGLIGLPHLDSGPFLSYGIQWIAFGVIAPIGLGYFIFSELRVRRAEQRARDVKAPGSDEPLTVEDKLADRYGRRR